MYVFVQLRLGFSRNIRSLNRTYAHQSRASIDI